jgi:hypothetical protein
MATERIDTVDNYFKRVNHVSTVSSLLFWLSVLCSFALFLTRYNANINYFVNVLFVIITFLYFIFSNWLSVFLLREAQSKRRVNLLSDSLGIKLDDEQTNLYYNNSQSPSIIRLGMNVFENTLFTWRITEQMVKLERIKVLLITISWILLVLLRDTNLNLITTVAQTIFTTGLVVSWIKIEVLRHSCGQIFNELRQVFLTNGLKANKKAISIILSLVFRYETTVASMGIHLSSKAFYKINPTVTEEWEKVKRNINL